MPDEKPPEKTGLDRLLAGKEAEMLAEPSLKVSEALGQAPEVKTPESTQEPLPVPPPGPTAEEVAATGKAPEAKPETPPPAETKPETKPTPPVEVLEDERRPWKYVRDMERRLMKEIAELRKQPAAPPPPVVTTEQAPTDDDPLGVKAAVREETSKYRQETETALAQERQLRLANEENQWIGQQEAAFRAQQPAYDKGVEFLVETERKEFRRAGGERVAANNILATAKLDTPEGRQAKAMIDEYADKNDLSDEEAARALASDLWIAQRRNLLVQGARAEGRSVAEVVWELITDRGFKAVETPPPATPANGTQQPTPQQKVEQAKRANEVAPSLSEMATSTQAPPMTIKTRAQLLDLAAKDMPAFTRYCMEMEGIDPDWHTKLPP